MSDAVTGKDGKVLIVGTGEIVEIRNWTLNRPMETPDATSMSSGGVREKKPGIKDGSGSFETINFQDLQGLEAVGSLQVGAAATASTPIFAGTILITDAPVETPYDDIVSYKHTFECSGPITVTVT